MNFAIMGEAAKHTPLSLRKKDPDIPWKEMAGMRDKLIHEYFGVRHDVVWKTVTARLPQVRSQIEKVLKQMNGEMGKTGQIRKG